MPKYQGGVPIMSITVIVDLNEDKTVPTPEITENDARRIGAYLGVDWNKIPVGEFHKGIAVEFEHADVIGLDAIAAGKIALAHLKERPDYYTKLLQMEKD